MRTVLLIDDDPEFVAKMHTMMSRLCDLLVAADVGAATRIVRRTRVDCIVLRRDSLQPHLDQWLEKPKLARIPVVILGKNSSATEWQEILQTGIDELLKDRAR